MCDSSSERHGDEPTFPEAGSVLRWPAPVIPLFRRFQHPDIAVHVFFSRCTDCALRERERGERVVRESEREREREERVVRDSVRERERERERGESSEGQ